MKHRFYYTSVRVRDLRRSLRFYTKVLGRKASGRGKMGHGREYVLLRTRFYTKYQKGEELDH